VAEVEIGFGPVVGDEDFAVLKRTHRAGVHIDVGIQLLIGDAQTAGFQNGRNGCRGQAFSQRRQNASGHKNKFRIFHADVLPLFL
jgi:hypothetical protein